MKFIVALTCLALAVVAAKDAKKDNDKPKRSVLTGNLGGVRFYGNHLFDHGLGYANFLGHGLGYTNFHDHGLGYTNLHDHGLGYGYGTNGIVVNSGLGHGHFISNGLSDGAAAASGILGANVARTFTVGSSGLGNGVVLANNGYQNSIPEVATGVRSGVTVGAARTVGVHTQSHTNVLRKILEEVPVGVPQPYPVTVTKAVPVPQPYTVTVPRPVPVPVHVKVPVEVPRPYPVRTPQPVPVQVRVNVPVEVPQPYPVTVTKTIQVPVAKPYAVREPHPVPVAVPHPVPVNVPHPVPVRVPTPVVVREPQVVDGGVSHHHIDSHLHPANGAVVGLGHGLAYDSGFGNGEVVSTYGHGVGNGVEGFTFGHGVHSDDGIATAYGLNGLSGNTVTYQHYH